MIIYLPTNSVNLYGSGTDADGSIISYSWKVSDSAGTYLFSNANGQQTQLNNLKQGIYKVQLTVTDNKGAKGYSTILITIGSSRQQATAIEEINIYPNPVVDVFTAKITDSEADRKVTLVLYDSRGVKVYEKVVNMVGNTKLETINISKLKAGVYMLQVTYENKNQIVKKIVKV